MSTVSVSASANDQRQLGLYFGALLLTVGLAEPTGLISLPLLFWMKNDLRLAPHSIAFFDAVALTPMYLGFAFGFLRDRLRLFGGDDRGLLLLAAPFAIASYCWIAGDPASWTRLLAGVVIAAFAFECLGATTEAMMTAAAHRHVMTGRLSALAEIGEIVPSVLSMVAGGWTVTHLAARWSFLIAAAATTLILAQAMWRPRAVFDLPAPAIAERPRGAIRRLLRHRPLWPAVAALFLWNFSPGWGTPLAFFLSDSVGLSAESFGLFRATGFASGALAAVVYALLCRRVPLRRTLRWAVVLNIAPAFLVLFAHNAVQAIAVSAVTGFFLGMLNIALFDLLRRSCPAQLEGTGVMLGYSLFSLGGTLGDVAGSWMFERAGLTACLMLDAAATAAVFLICSRIPDSVLAACDGEREPAAAYPSFVVGKEVAA